jgi:hypothetical protein
MASPKRLAAQLSAPVSTTVHDLALEKLKEYPRVLNTDTVRDKAKNEFGTDIGVAHVPELFSDNAVYLHPDSAGPYLRKVLRRKYVPEELKEKLRSASGRHGLILTGKDMKRRGVLEHEYGHGIAASKGGPLEKLVSKPWVMQGRGIYHKMPSIMAALLGGKYGVRKGMLSGAAAGLITDSPRLYAEHAANRYARELLPEDVEQSISYTKPMISNVVTSTLPFASLGAFSGLGHKLTGAAKRMLLKR